MAAATARQSDPPERQPANYCAAAAQEIAGCTRGVSNPRRTGRGRQDKGGLSTPGPRSNYGGKGLGPRRASPDLAPPQPGPTRPLESNFRCASRDVHGAVPSSTDASKQTEAEFSGLKGRGGVDVTPARGCEQLRADGGTCKQGEPTQPSHCAFEPLPRPLLTLPFRAEPRQPRLRRKSGLRCCPRK